MVSFKTILHPTDFSPASEYAFHLACSLARDHRARLIVLHVNPSLSVMHGTLAPHENLEGYHEKLWEEFNRLVATDPRTREVNLKSELLVGDPVKEILRMARERDCDLIVLGTHGRTGLFRLLMGSVAEEILRKAPCPVLAAKAPAPVAKPAETPWEEAAEAR
jgi:nucleotide-binding universal stress UspA family protein